MSCRYSLLLCCHVPYHSYLYSTVTSYIHTCFYDLPNMQVWHLRIRLHFLIASNSIIALNLLIGGSRIVFLDEPTSGMDPYSRRFTWNVIRQHREGRSAPLASSMIHIYEVVVEFESALTDKSANFTCNLTDSLFSLAMDQFVLMTDFVHYASKLPARQTFCLLFCLDYDTLHSSRMLPPSLISVVAFTSLSITSSPH